MPQATRDPQLFYQYHCKQRPALNWPESTENINRTTSFKMLVKKQCPKYEGKSYFQKFFLQSHFREQGPGLNRLEPLENKHYMNWSEMLLKNLAFNYGGILCYEKHICNVNSGKYHIFVIINRSISLCFEVLL